MQTTQQRVRTKFTVVEIKQLSPTGSLVVFTPQYVPGLEEDRRLRENIPQGRLEMQINNPELLSQLPQGSTHYLDISPVIS